MQVLDGNVRAVWFDHVEDVLHLTAPDFHYVLRVWPHVVAREWDRVERRWSRAARPLEVDVSRPPHFPAWGWQQHSFAFSHPRRVFGTAALAAYRNAIPERVRAAIEPFPAFQGALLEFASGGPACVDLLVGNPALASLLVTAWLDRRVGYGGLMEEARGVVASGVRQREVLEWLGALSTEAVARLLRKVPARCLTLTTVAALTQAVRTPGVPERLRHLPVMTGAILQVAAHPMLRSVTNRFLRELLELSLEDDPDHGSRSASRSQTVVDELSELEAAWLRCGPDVPLRIDSVASIGRQYGELYRTVHRADLREHSADVLPAPPFPGNDEIVPITTVGALTEESERQRHCVITYLPSVQNQRRAIYQVLKPQRATLSLRSNRGRWELEELRGKANTLVREETYNSVYRWLRTAAEDQRARDAGL